MNKRVELKHLKLTMELWGWLKDNPLKDKKDYTEYNVDNYLSRCPCCDIYRIIENNRRVCIGCPLKPNKIKTDKTGINYYCHPSYYSWSCSRTRRTKKKHATIIYEILKKAYVEKKG